MREPKPPIGSQMRKFLPKYRILLYSQACFEAHDECRTFTIAAMDTTSSALARTLWILAQHQDAQDNLRLEIRKSRKGDKDLIYDELMNLPYLDAVCRETLRLWVVMTCTRVWIQIFVLLGILLLAPHLESNFFLFTWSPKTNFVVGLVRMSFWPSEPRSEGQMGQK